MAMVTTATETKARLRSREALCAALEAADGLNNSERQLARTSGLCHSTVNHIFTGRRTTCSGDTARVLERALGVEPGTLFAFRS